MTPSGARRASPFRAGHARTLDLLSSELEKLKATDVVFELAMREQDIRVDGMPRANARAPEHPGVIVSFDSKHGPLRYATDTFTTWSANLRGIALGLEALRQVERYGITRRGEQYVGWRAIAAKSQSGEDARDALVAIIQKHRGRAQRDDLDLMDKKRLVRLAQTFTHDDIGGDRAEWDAVMQAARTLGL